MRLLAEMSGSDEHRALEQALDEATDRYAQVTREAVDAPDPEGAKVAALVHIRNWAEIRLGEAAPSAEPIEGEYAGSAELPDKS